MSHANAALTPRQRLRLARQIVDEGWPVVGAARYFRVSYPTAAKWARRYVELGEAGMVDRSSRPHRHPYKTPQPVVKHVPRQVVGRNSSISKLGMVGLAVPAYTSAGRFQAIASCGRTWL